MQFWKILLCDQILSNVHKTNEIKLKSNIMGVFMYLHAIVV